MKYLIMLNMYLINIIMISVIESKPRVCYNKRNKKVVFMDGGSVMKKKIIVLITIIILLL